MFLVEIYQDGFLEAQYKIKATTYLSVASRVNEKLNENFVPQEGSVWFAEGDKLRGLIMTRTKRNSIETRRVKEL